MITVSVRCQTFINYAAWLKLDEKTETDHFVHSFDYLMWLSDVMKALIMYAKPR